uniref:Protein kinase domain-containing protein n=1 Tax=Maylandia zebra TaxID=106582 RepID=A0A3P9DVA4_9CICH
MLPTSDSKLLAKWQGPFEVQKKLGPTTYKVSTPGLQRGNRVLHVNLLKEWIPRTENKTEGLLIHSVDEEEEVNDYLPSVTVSVLDLSHLTSEQQSQVTPLINSDIFQKYPGRTSLVEHDIVLKPDAAVKRMSYRIPERFLVELKDKVDLMLSLGIIQPSTSEWCNPLVLAPKKDSTIRFCIDFRYLNSISKFDSYPMPRIDDLIERLGKRKQTHYTMSANPSFGSDELGISKGTILGDHHMVEAFLGEGGFGVVTKCRDTKNNQTVAVKVNKSNPEILLQAKLEIFILEQLRRLDPDRCNIVEWNGYFLDGERICLNFELLDQSLSDYIGDRNNQGLPMRELRPILHQLANALFHLGSVGIVHADLKPVNIMVVNRSESQVRVKLIDFGIACNTSAVIPGDCVGTIGYCAPEIMLGTPYDEAIDMWSLGLVAVELATGVPLYPGEDDYDVLKFIIETQGQLPDHLLESGLYTDSYFIEDNHNERRWTFKTPEQFQYETDYRSKETRSIKLKLIKEMLALDANQRITPSEVLKHPFFDPGCTPHPWHRCSSMPSWVLNAP